MKKQNRLTTQHRTPALEKLLHCSEDSWSACPNCLAKDRKDNLYLLFIEDRAPDGGRLLNATDDRVEMVMTQDLGREWKPLSQVRPSKFIAPVSVEAVLEWYVKIDDFTTSIDGGYAELLVIVLAKLRQLSAKRK